MDQTNQNQENKPLIRDKEKYLKRATKEQKEKVIELRKQHLSTYQIAQQVGLSHQTVLKIIKDHGLDSSKKFVLDKRKEEIKKKIFETYTSTPMSLLEVCKHLGISEPTLRKYINLIKQDQKYKDRFIEVAKEKRKFKGKPRKTQSEEEGKIEEEGKTEEERKAEEEEIENEPN